MIIIPYICFNKSKTMEEIKDLRGDWPEDSYKLLGKTTSEKVDKLFELYEKDRFIARVIYMNDNTNYSRYRLMLFTRKNGNFNIVYFRKTFGISKTNVMYSHDKRLFEVIFKGGKFYLIDNTKSRKRIITLTRTSLLSVCNHARHSLQENALYESILRVLTCKFTWLRFMVEHNVCENVAFNTIISKKLYNLKKALKHQYKTTYPVAKMLHGYTIGNNNYAQMLIRNLDSYSPYITNMESFSSELMNDPTLLYDSVKMAKTLGKTVNLSWSRRRLKEEHDEWAKIISDIVFIDGDREMTIGALFLEFEEFSGYQVIKTTKEMAYEGKRQNHCVATYVNKVDSGGTAIVTTKEYTIELVSKYTQYGSVIVINQMKGYSNCNPTMIFQKQFSDMVFKFNEFKTKGMVTEGNKVYKQQNLTADDILPF